MKKTILYTVLALGMTAVSCSRSGLEGPRQPGEPNKTPVTAAFSSVAVPAPITAYSNAPDSKASLDLTDGGIDGQVHDLWAVQYDAAGKLVGTPYYTADIPAGTPAVGGSGLDYTYDGLSLRLTSSGGAAHTVCFVANTHNGSLFTVDNDVSTLDRLRETVLGIGDEYRPAAAAGVVMMGSYTGEVASGTPVTGVRLERLAAKVVFKYKTSLPGFTVSGVQLKNVPAGFRFAEAAAGNVNFPAVTADSHIDYPAEDLAKAAPDGDYKKIVWYMPENLSRASAPVPAVGDRTPDKSDGRPAYVEVSGILNAGGQCRKAVYRILLGDLGSAGTSFADFNVKRNHIYTVTLDVQGVNAGDNRITVESFDMSNCGMVSPNGSDSVTFDIRKCLNNGFTTEQALNAMLGASSTLTADVLWQDGNVIGTSDIALDKVNGLLTVKSTKVTEGNAVVALYPDGNKAQGTVLWSWHIWVTKYRPDEAGIATRAANTAYPVTGGQVHTYGTEFQKENGLSRVIMDRNLGATAALYKLVTTNAENYPTYGLFYQWGRKDPFPKAPEGDVVQGSVASQPTYNSQGEPVGFTEKVLGPVTIATAVKNPKVFYYNETEPYDWNSVPDDGLWGDGAPKSAYDPCPKGWRIAPIGTWDDFSVLTSFNLDPSWVEMNVELAGGLYAAGSVNAFYPAAGLRHWSGAALYNVGFSGFSSTSTVHGDNIYLMAFDCNGVNPRSDGHRRARGFQVRCIQE
ncbi:MAG: DUF4906 domain-containing protein [Rikenellaceae bacterium]|nr:DUF4906 domain-containing protein [Rikenellaceae bacterium]